MRSHLEVTEFQRRHPVRVMPPASGVLKEKMHDAVARRAFQLYELHGCAGGHDRDDWGQAEAEVVRPLDCGVLVQDERICLTTNVSCFGPGILELWIEPHRVTLCGPCVSAKLDLAAGTPAGNGQKNLVFRTHEMKEELDPAEVTVRFNGPAMHLYLHRAHKMPQQAALAHAA